MSDGTPAATEIAGVTVLQFELHSDARGTFGRLWDAATLYAAGYDPALAQVSLSESHLAGTIRGLHLAVAPFEETKLVRCLRGAIFDVAVDLRPGSPTLGKWVTRTLSAENRLALVIPPGVAHGFQTLLPASDVLYCIDRPFEAAAARSLRYDDPALGIPWPLMVTSISERDAAAPPFSAYV